MAEVTLRITADARGAISGIEVVNRELGGLVPASAAAGSAGQRAGEQIEGGMSRARAGVQSISQQLERFQSLVATVAGVAAGLGTALTVANLADQYGQMSARLKNVIGDSMSLAAAQDAVYAVAQRTRSELSATGDLVSSLSRAYTAAGMSAQEAFGTSLRLGEAINNAITASGTSAATAQGMITQLGQALASGALRGDEFNSMMEGSPRLAQALAAGLDVPIGRLRAMAEAGELTREAITRALTGAQFDVLAAEAAAMPLTIAQGWTALGNAFEQYVGRLNESTGATSAVSGVLKALADNFDLVAMAAGAAAAAALTYAGAQGLAAMGGAANAASTALAAIITRLNIVTPLFAWSTGTMTGTAAAMVGLRNAGGAVLAMLGGWPVVIAAAATGLTLLISRLLSAGDAAAEAARKAREEQRELAREMANARQQRRTANPNLILADIAEQERVLQWMLRANSEQSQGVIKQRQYLKELREEYAKATTAAAGLAGANGTAAAAAEKHNAQLRAQVQQMREQVAQAKGGAAAVQEMRAAGIDWTQATAEQRAEQAKLTAELKQLEGQIKASAAATSGRAAATRDAAAADQSATEALKAHKAAMDALKGAAGDFEQLRDRVADALATPAERAQREYQEALTVLDRYRDALMSLGPIDPATLASIEETREGLATLQQQALTGGEAVIEGGQQVVDAAAEQSRTWGDYWAEAGNAMANAVGDWFANGFRGLTDSLKRIVQTAISDFVSMIARQRLILPIMASIGFPVGAQAGGLSGMAGQGGMFGPLGGMFSGLSQGLGGMLGTGLTNFGGMLSQGAMFQGAGLLGGLGNFGSGLSMAGANLSGLGFFGSMGANLGGGFAALGSGSIAAGLGQLVPVLGQIAAIATVINSLAGGRLFGTSRRPDSGSQTLALGEGGGTASATMTTVRQRSLARGRAWDTQNIDPGDEAVQAARQLFDRVRAVMVQAAQQMQAEAPAMISAALRTVQQFDKDGKVTATKFFVDILGRTWEEATAEAATQRLIAEALFATIDASLGTTVQAATTAAASAGGEVVEGFGEAIGAAAGSTGNELREGVATMLKGASSAVQGEASAIAERWRSDAAALMDGAQLLLAAATDIRRGVGLLGEGSLTQVVDLIEDLQASGETLAQTYARVAGSAALLQEALDLSGVTLSRTREEFVRFATDISTAAGGVERAQALWSSYFQTFFTAEERAVLAQQRARANADREFADIGLNVGDFLGAGGLAAFRQQFDQILKTGSAEAIVQWLEAAESLGILTQATAQLGAGAVTTAQSLTEFMQGIDAALAGNAAPEGLAEQLERQRAANAEMIARATELGASEEQLSRVRQLGQQRIDAIIGSVSPQTAAVTGALRTLGIAASGTAEQIAVAASGVSGDFGSLFEGFLGSFYSEAERQAMRQATAQQALAQAMQAAGLAADQAITREQLRAQIEAALAAGNYTLAEALLRVAAAMNQVESAAGNAAAGVGRLVDDLGRPIGGNPYGVDDPRLQPVGGGGGGGSDPTGGAGQQLVDELSRVRQGLREWLQSLTTGELSPERPRQRLARAQAEYERVLALAQAGDVEALRQLQGAAQQVLQLGRQVWASGSGYTSLYNQIIGQIGGLAGFTPTPIGGGAGGGGGGIRPGDDLGDVPGVRTLDSAATAAARALAQLAAAVGLPSGALGTGLSAAVAEGFAARPDLIAPAARPAPSIDTRPVVEAIDRSSTTTARALADLARRVEQLESATRSASAEQTRALDRQTDVLKSRR